MSFHVFLSSRVVYILVVTQSLLAKDVATLSDFSFVLLFIIKYFADVLVYICVCIHIYSASMNLTRYFCVAACM